MRGGRRFLPNFALLLFLLAHAVSCASMKWGFYRTSLTPEDPEFLQLVSAIADAPLVGGNRVEILVNGDRIFPSMLQAVRDAKETINLETYIFKEDSVGREFAAALIERAKAGVEVRVLADDIGSKVSDPLRQLMAKSGVRLVIFNPWNWWHMHRSNVRTHRKLLIVDGRVGFTGGVGIEKRWEGNADTSEHWRETHVRVEGPVAGQLQSLFAENWERATKERIGGEKFFPRLRPAGDVLACSFGKSRTKNWSNIREMFLLPLAASRRYYYLNSAYFIPDIDCMKALRDAVERGVDVRVIVAGEDTDIQANHLLAWKNYGRLLKAGVKIYEYTGANMHAKTVVSDGLLVIIGSANFDGRTFNYNYESNLVVFDEKVATEMERHFAADLKRSREITFNEWEKRSMLMRIEEQAVGVIEGWM